MGCPHCPHCLWPILMHYSVSLGVRLTKIDRYGSSANSVTWEEETDRLLWKCGTEEFRVRLIRFGFGSKRWNRIFQEPENNTFNCKFWQHFAWFSCSQKGQFKQQCSIKQQYNTYILLFSQIFKYRAIFKPAVKKNKRSNSLVRLFQVNSVNQVLEPN